MSAWDVLFKSYVPIRVEPCAELPARVLLAMGGREFKLTAGAARILAEKLKSAAMQLGAIEAEEKRLQSHRDRFAARKRK